MSNIGPIASINVRNTVISNCWNYVHENFHKFNEQNKIKVVLAIISKDMPTKVEGEALAQRVVQIVYTNKNETDGNRLIEAGSTSLPAEIPAKQ